MRGAIVGNYIGLPYEFKSNRNKEVFPLLPPINNFIDDDMLLTIGTFMAITESIPYKDVYQGLAQKYRNLPYGARFQNWIDDGVPYNSMGNGAAMRVSPIAWLYDDLDLVISEAERSSEISHNHPEGIASAIFVAKVIYLLRTKKIDKKDLHLLCDKEGWHLEDNMLDLRTNHQYTELARPTVEASLTCFIHSTSWEDAVRNSISIGGDADTLGAITGSIAEAYYGVPLDLWNTVLEKTLPDLQNIMIKM